MRHLLNAALHGTYVYIIALIGAIGAAQISTTNLSTPHDALLALGPAALAALVKVAPKVPAIVAEIATLTTAAAPTEPATGLAPEAE